MGLGDVVSNFPGFNGSHFGAAFSGQAWGSLATVLMMPNCNRPCL
jgi:hypothetical protein